MLRSHGIFLYDCSNHFGLARWLCWSKILLFDNGVALGERINWQTGKMYKKENRGGVLEGVLEGGKEAEKKETWGGGRTVEKVPNGESREAEVVLGSMIRKSPASLCGSSASVIPVNIQEMLESTAANFQAVGTGCLNRGIHLLQGKQNSSLLLALSSRVLLDAHICLSWLQRSNASAWSPRSRSLEVMQWEMVFLR